jgi:hypothetical protein
VESLVGLILRQFNHTEGLHVIAYSATLDLPREVALHLAGLLRGERLARGTRRGRRSLGCFKQAVLALRWFLDGTRVSQLAHDNGVSVPAAYRYLHEAVDLLAAQAPDIHTAIERARTAGLTHLLLDGTLIRTDRVAARTLNTRGRETDLWYSGKHKHHGGNVQVITAPDGYPLWTSPVEPGSVHDLVAARAHALPALYKAAAEGLLTLTDMGYIGAGIGIRTPVKRRPGNELAQEHLAYNAVQTALRAVGERGNSLLKTTFKALRHVSLDPSRIGDITAAALVILHLRDQRTT